MTLLLLLGAAFLASIAAGLTVPHPGDIGSIDRAQEIRFILTTSAAALFYAVAILRVCARPAARHALPLILLVGLAARLLVLPMTPLNSTDIYRYVWDGRVQAAGINPYRYVPADPALAPLRDTAPGPAAIFPNVNRAEYAPTIYPPAAQAIFAATGLLWSSLLGMKAVMLGFDLLTACAILLILRAAGRPASHVLVWAWNPLVIWEFSNGGHIDSPAIAFTALAALAAILGRATWSGLAIGLAVSTKLLPAALFPALWRPLTGGRLAWRAPLAAATVVLGGYAVYAGVGWRVLGFLPGYADEEQLSNGGGYLLLRLIGLAGPLPPWAGKAYLACGLLALAAAALLVMRRPLPAGPAARADVIGLGLAVMVGTLLAVLSPHYPWYLTALVLPAALLPRPLSRPALSDPAGPVHPAIRWRFPAWSMLWPTLAGPVLYLDFSLLHLQWAALVYLPCLPLLWLDRRTWQRSLPET